MLQVDWKTRVFESLLDVFTDLWRSLKKKVHGILLTRLFLAVTHLGSVIRCRSVQKLSTCFPNQILDVDACFQPATFRFLLLTISHSSVHQSTNWYAQIWYRITYLPVKPVAFSFFSQDAIEEMQWYRPKQVQDAKSWENGYKRNSKLIPNPIS